MSEGSPLEALRAQRAELIQANQNIVSEAGDNPLSEEAMDLIAKNTVEIDALAKQIALREQTEAQAASLATPNPRKVQPEPPQAAAGAGMPANTVGAPRSRPGTHDFQDFSEFVGAVARASAGVQTDPRLTAFNSTPPGSLSSEGVGEDGGFAVPPDFRTTIEDRIGGEESLLGRTDGQTTTSNSFWVPVDETPQWDNANGIIAYWESEASQIDTSKIKIKSEHLRLNKLAALVPVTDELLSDATAVGNYVSSKAPAAMNDRINSAIIRGTGAGTMLGLMEAGCAIQLTRSAGGQITFADINAMYARMLARYMPNAVWLANQDILPELVSMEFPGDASPVFIPPGTLLSSGPFGSLMGRPILFQEHCSALGDAGDLILVNLNEYLTVRKTTGIRQDTSMHLWFDRDIVAFRFIMRVAGQPWLTEPVTRGESGAATLSSIIVLN